MAKRVQLRRGTTAQTNTFTGAVGEVTVDTDKKTLVVHDGTTVGGTPLLKASQLVDASETVKGIVELATQAEVNTGTDTTRVVTPATLSGTFLQQTKNALNASGSAPVYACRAWVNFDGTGTPSIRASGNVSSITDNGVGNYTINFTTALPDANYVPQLASTSRSNDSLKLTVASSTEGGSPTLKTTTALRVSYWAVDLSEVYVSIFR